jgi:hypothetical protein
VFPEELALLNGGEVDGGVAEVYAEGGHGDGFMIYDSRFMIWPERNRNDERFPALFSEAETRGLL